MVLWANVRPASMRRDAALVARRRPAVETTAPLGTGSVQGAHQREAFAAMRSPFTQMQSSLVSNLTLLSLEARRLPLQPRIRPRQFPVVTVKRSYRSPLENGARAPPPTIQALLDRFRSSKRVDRSLVPADLWNLRAISQYAFHRRRQPLNNRASKHGVSKSLEWADGVPLQTSNRCWEFALCHL